LANLRLSYIYSLSLFLQISRLTWQ